MPAVSFSKSFKIQLLAGCLFALSSFHANLYTALFHQRDDNIVHAIVPKRKVAQFFALAVFYIKAVFGQALRGDHFALGCLDVSGQLQHRRNQKNPVAFCVRFLLLSELF